MVNEIEQLKEHYRNLKNKPNPPSYMAKLKRILELEGEIKTDSDEE